MGEQHPAHQRMGVLRLAHKAEHLHVVAMHQNAVHEEAQRKLQDEYDDGGDDEFPGHACLPLPAPAGHPHTSAVTGCSMKPRNAATSSAPSAPSTTRWSQESVPVIMLANATPPSAVSTACRRAAPTARMVACGGLMMAENSRTPYMPRFEIALAPPWYSFGFNFFSRARAARSRISAESAESDLVSTLRSTGVISPPS